MRKHILQVIFEDDDNFEVRKYSGRAMYGKECLGIVVDDIKHFNTHIFNRLRKLFDSFEYHDDTIDNTLADLAQASRHMRTDNMGQSTIVYFPNIKLVDDDDDEDTVA